MSTDGTLQPAANTEKIVATITYALAERSALPRYDELLALHDELVSHIEALRPLAIRRTDRLWHGSVEWYRKASTLGRIDHEVAQGLGPGLQSAASRVRSLGYTCQWLLENSGVLDGASTDEVAGRPR
ncbi:DUF6415 family natural product biosynthesis protein [Streptomyces sp. NPDC047071]|uniref:DUF6415 family natural product biosynthesis protein n=1 Tax=Streptomyces sp. NPDC047071 TaxID=3154808 RepID=UPI0034523C8E